MSILKLRTISTAIGATVVVFLSGCNPDLASGSDFKEITVDQHVFRVPEKYLVKGSIPWLPEGQHEGLSFIINPEAQPEKQKIVGINSTRNTCNPKTLPASNMLGSACSSLDGQNDSKNDGGFSPEKFYPYEGVTFQWEYRVKNDDGSYQSVADCTSIKGRQDGLCHSLGEYDGLVYSVSIHDSEIDLLPEVWKKVRELLASWERKPASPG